MSAGEVDTAEVAFAGCEEVDKLQYMLYIKQLPNKEARLAELALYRHSASEAEGILLQVASAKACRHLCMFLRFCKDPFLACKVSVLLPCLLHVPIRCAGSNHNRT